MRLFRLALAGSLFFPAILAPTSHADASVICRTYIYSSGPRRGWRRVCWRVPERRYYAAPVAPYRHSRDVPWQNYSARDDDDDHHTQDADDDVSSSPNLFDEVDDTPSRTYRPQPWRPPVLKGWDDGDGAPKRYTSPPATSPNPEQLATFLFIVGIVVAAVLFARFIAWLDAVVKQRRLDKLERQVLSAQTLTDRLRYDAREADALIRALSREAYRRGAGQ